MVRQDGISDSTYLQRGLDYQGRGIMIVGVRSDGYWTYCSAVRLNEWYALTASHCFFTSPGLTWTYSIRDSRSVFGQPGNSRNTTFTAILPGFNGPGDQDLAVLKFDRPLPGLDAEIADVSLNEVANMCGYGYSGPAGGTLSFDGQRRGWLGRVWDVGSTPGVNTFRTQFYSYSAVGEPTPRGKGRVAIQVPLFSRLMAA